MKRTILLILLASLTSILLANGDPTTKYSALIASTNPVPKKIIDVQIISEKLYIRLGKHTDVVVKYVLYNNSDNDFIDIDYGFPVDYEGGGDDFSSEDLTSDYVSEKYYTLGWKDKYIKQMAFYVDGEQMPAKASEEIALNNHETPLRENYTDPEWGEEDFEMDYFYSQTERMSRKWFYTQFSIKKNESITLEVRYSIMNEQRSNGSAPTMLGASNSRCKLNYEVAPSSYWGNGQARDFFVQIDASNLNNKNGNLPIEITGMDFTQSDYIFTHRSSNFDFTDAEAINVEYTLLNTFNLSELLNTRLENDKYEVSICSELEKYPVANMLDMDFHTATVITNNGGKGEKITIDFKKPTLVSNILLVNGYMKSRATYDQNNRIKRLKVSSVQHNSEKAEQSYDAPYYIEDEPYSPLYFENLLDHPNVYNISLNYSWTRTKVSKITIEVEDVYKGNKYNDLCISEILIFKQEIPGTNIKWLDESE